MALLATGAWLALVGANVQAQTIYRIVGPDGRVTFSDKPPAAGEKATLLATDGRSATENSLVDSLPFELRQIAQRYPVTLYSGDNCTPCNSGRSLLLNRGIPFVERTVTTPQDGEALKRLSGDNSLPFLSIGGQRLKGFSDAEWTQFLDAAGYPAQSKLPANYRPSAAIPLVSMQKPSATPAAPKPDQASPATDGTGRSPTPTVNPDNPAGITF